MPHHIQNPTFQYVNRNGATITMLDYTGKRHTQFIPTAGGGVNTNADRELAEAIGECSNAFVLAYGKSESNEFRISDAKYFDEADAQVESQLVIVFKHDTDPYQTREIIIPAPDASLFLDDMVTPDFNNEKLADVVQKGMDLLNDDGSILDTGDFHTYYGYKTTRKIGKRTRKTNLNLPTPSEPGALDNPPGEPGNPVIEVP